GRGRCRRGGCRYRLRRHAAGRGWDGRGWRAGRYRRRPTGRRRRRGWRASARRENGEACRRRKRFEQGTTPKDWRLWRRLPHGLPRVIPPRNTRSRCWASLSLTLSPAEQQVAEHPYQVGTGLNYDNVEETTQAEIDAYLMAARRNHVPL